MKNEKEKVKEKELDKVNGGIFFSLETENVDPEEDKKIEDDNDPKGIRVRG